MDRVACSGERLHCWRGPVEIDLGLDEADRTRSPPSRASRSAASRRYRSCMRSRISRIDPRQLLPLGPVLRPGAASACGPRAVDVGSEAGGVATVQAPTARAPKANGPDGDGDGPDGDLHLLRAARAARSAGSARSARSARSMLPGRCVTSQKCEFRDGALISSALCSSALGSAEPSPSWAPRGGRAPARARARRRATVMPATASLARFRAPGSVLRRR